MAKILVIEDEAVFSDLISAFLKQEGHTIEVVENGDEAADLLRFYKYDLIISDWMLPGLEGIDVVRKFRSTGGETPILMLTAKSKIDDKADGLDAGADDYLTKPFEVKELSARVRALLRRPTSFAGNILKVGRLELEPGTFKVMNDGEEVQLLPREFALLEFLMKHPNEVFSPEALLDRVWASDSEASPDTIRTYVKRLRKKLDKEDKPSILKTIHGKGYKLEA